MMSKNDFFEIEVLGWDKHNGGGKTSKWFKFSNRFFFDDKVLALTDLQKLCYISILCLCSIEGRSTIKLHINHLRSMIDLSRIGIRTIVMALEQNQLVSIKNSPQIRLDKIREDNIYSSFENEPLSNGEKEPKPHKEKKSARPKSTFDFEIIYASWPRKEGKDRGMEKLEKKITTQELYDQFASAVKHYTHHVIKTGKDREFIKQWSTFVGKGDTGPWRDWIEGQPEANPKSKSLNGWAAER